MAEICPRTVEVHAAGEEDYLIQCYEYPAYFVAQTKNSAILMSEPCDSTVDANSVRLGKVAEGTILQVEGLYKNTVGEYWYKVLRYGETVYVPGMDVTVLEHKVGDVSISDVISPACIGYGNSFSIGGTISAAYNNIYSVTASMYEGRDITKAPYMTSSDYVNRHQYTLDNSTVDANLSFSRLEVGNYTYVVRADIISYYVDEYGELADSKKTILLEQKVCTVNGESNRYTATAKGIDVSEWQEGIDWSLMKDDIDFAIIRTSYGTRFMDSEYYNHMQGCIDNQIPVGVYMYSMATTAAEARAEAEYTLNILGGQHLDLPVYFDLEDPSQQELNNSTKLEIVQAFCEVIKAAGYEPGIYSSLSWFESYLTDPYYDTLPKWVAQYNSECNYTGGTSIWQYSDSGNYSGYSGGIDSNYYYGEWTWTNGVTGYQGQCEGYSANLDATMETSAYMMSLPTIYNDSSIVQSVAQGTKLRITKLYQNTYGELWYQVVSGDTTGYVLAEKVTIDSVNYRDIGIMNPVMSSNIASGSSCSIGGNLYSHFSQIQNVYAKVYEGEDTGSAPVLSGSGVAGAKSYFLSGSEVDRGVTFGVLSDGYYTYEISVDVKTYYVDEAGTIQSKLKNLVLWTKPFTVGETAIRHTHAYVKDAAVEATCTGTGLTEGSHCSSCGLVQTEQIIIPKADHTPGEAVKENVSDTSYDSVIYCKHCQEELERKTINIGQEETDQLEKTKLGIISNVANGLKVTWEKVSGASGYYIYRKTSGSLQKIATVKDGLAERYVDETAKVNTTYTYTVCAYNASGRGEYDQTGLTLKRVLSPVVKGISNAVTGIKVEWNTVEGATGYEVLRRVKGGTFKAVAKIAGANISKYTDTTAKEGIMYIYTVRAVSGTSKGYMSSKALYMTRVDTPTIISVKNGVSGIKVSWASQPEAEGFAVYRKERATDAFTQIATIRAGKYTYTDTTAVAGKTYYYCVKANIGKYKSSYERVEHAIVRMTE